MYHLKSYALTAILAIAMLTGATPGGSWHIIASPDAGSSSDLSGVAVISPRNIWAVGSSLTPAPALLSRH
jgi:hypothetical protein